MKQEKAFVFESLRRSTNFLTMLLKHCMDLSNSRVLTTITGEREIL